VTPIGHIAVVGLVAAVRSDFRLVPLAIGSVLPDIDFLASPFGGADHWHRAGTHSIFFAVACGVVARFAFRLPVSWAAGLTLGVVLHIAFDSILDTNPANGIGVPFLWPFIRETWAPFSLLEASCSGWTSPGDLLYCTAAQMWFEFGIWLLGGIGWYLWWRRSSKHESHRVVGGS
jgi:membrane-bound metal-dependent hydrolase YbcI (DUF457 family)